MNNVSFFIKQLICYLLLLIVLIFTYSIFFLTRPFSYIDSFNSTLKCDNGKSNSSGASLVFSYDGSLDKFNQIKAAKVCAYDIVFDYYNQFPIPINEHYKYIIEADLYSSWYQAFFVVLLFLAFTFPILGLFNMNIVDNLKELYYKNNIISLLFLSTFIFASLIFFQLTIKNKLQSVYCKNILRIQLNEFKLSVNKSGKEYPRIEYEWAKTQKDKLMAKCLLKGYIYKR